MKKLSSGAEAILYEDGDVVIKYRKKKSYRIKEIDEPIRYHRTKAEFQALKRCNETGINVPSPIKISKEGDKLYMSKIDGKQMDYSFSLSNMSQIGEMVASMHTEGVIHGDLTTANILINRSGAVIIDFGLSYFSRKDEDRATDIAMLKSALRSRHPKEAEDAYRLFIASYRKRLGKEFKGVETHLKDIERRRRYHENG
ncbi:MAG: Kae1-associated serine/threonine protein kinase [Candidatus Parvarchaeota archaeon]|nr:Kae1-associated serine/threonine protein kinase [Candidatus Parvarchaeota archaeon]